jgi:Zn-dependent protease with chaperone function
MIKKAFLITLAFIFVGLGGGIFIGKNIGEIIPEWIPSVFYFGGLIFAVLISLFLSKRKLNVFKE